MGAATFEAALQQELAAWEAAGLRRELAPACGVDFTTNDYLGLSRDPHVVAAARAALEDYGAGAGASRLLRGHLPLHAEAEAAAAGWLDSEAALLFPSGWHANLAVTGTLATRGDAVFSDAHNHASLIDGCRLSRARVQVFQHADPGDLGRLLRSARGARRRLILTESVFSMGGDLAPLDAYARLARAHDAWLVIDEAHAAGLFGPEGAGRGAQLADRSRILARVVTGGKALGVCGAFVAAAHATVGLLLHRGRAFVFTTAPSPATAAALRAAIRIVRAEPARRERALANAARLRSQLAAKGLRVGGHSAIVPVLLGAPERALAVAARVREAGFDVRAVRPPTVPPGTSRLRIVCHAAHAAEQIDGLAAALAAAAGGSPAPSPAPPRQAARPRPPIVVAGTGTGVGKTVLAALLARHARRCGLRPAYLKPVQTGGDSDTAAVRRLAELRPAEAPEPPVALPQPASVDQAARAAGCRVDAASLAATVRGELGRNPAASWILEAAGGLLVPFNDLEDQADFLAQTGFPLVVAAASGLGTLNHTRLTLEAAAGRGLRVLSLFLVGAAHEPNLRTLRSWLAPLPVRSLPFFDPLGPEALDEWLARNPLPELEA